MPDNRFKDYPIDNRFPSAGLDARFVTGVDLEQRADGVDTRFDGPLYADVGAGSITAPAAYTAPQWALSDAPSPDGDTLTVNITAPVDDGGAPLTEIQFRRNLGAASTLPGGTGLGPRQITVLATTAADIQIRAGNAVGFGAWSDTKSDTPTVSPAPNLTDLAYDSGTGTASATVDVGGTVWWFISNSSTPLADGAAVKALVQGGTPVLEGSFAVTAGVNDEAIDTSSLADGTWYLHAAAENSLGVMADEDDVVSFVKASVTGWNLLGASYMSKTFDLSGKDAAPAGMYISPDGTRLYFIGTTNDDLHQYDIGTPWDITTASFVRTFDSSPDEITPSAVFFKNDGTRCYILGNSGNEINEYTLGTAWNISTCTLNHTFSLTATETTPQGIWFRDDGLKMYTIGQAGDAVDEFTLGTAWVLSTASYIGTGVVVTQEATTTGLFLKDDGTKLYVIGTTGQAVFQYTLTTPWDITTRSYDSVSFSVASETTTPQCVVFGDGGTKFYILSNTGPIYQYEAV